MVAINANVSASQKWLPLSHDESIDLAVGYYTIDSEHVYIDTGPHPATTLADLSYNGRRAQRGVGGTTAASHLSGATLTRYYPEAPGGGVGTPAAHVDPQTATPQQIAEALIAAGLMEAS